MPPTCVTMEPQLTRGPHTTGGKTSSLTQAEAQQKAKEAFDNAKLVCDKVGAKFRDDSVLSDDLKKALKDEFDEFTYPSREEEFPNIPLFEEPGDARTIIEQGNTSNCFLIGALQAIVNQKIDPKSIIVDHCEERGIYAVVLYQCGGWHWILVDDHIPVGVSAKGKESCLVATGKTSYWPSILEKAYALMIDSWDHISEGGQEGLVLQLFTGAFTFFPEWDTWEEFEKCVNSNRYFVTASRAKGKRKNYFGIYSAHVYTVKSAFAVGGRRCVVLENPHDKHGYTGPFSDDECPQRIVAGEELEKKIEKLKLTVKECIMPFDVFRCVLPVIEAAYKSPKKIRKVVPWDCEPKPECRSCECKFRFVAACLETNDVEITVGSAKGRRFTASLEGTCVTNVDDSTHTFLFSRTANSCKGLATFRIDDLPTGEYVLTIELGEPKLDEPMSTDTLFVRVALCSSADCVLVS